jgi:RNA recognition motif-containing protein
MGKRKERDDYSAAPSAAKVFVGGLDYSLSEDDFRKHFEVKFGPVKAAQIVRDANSGQSKGFGFVTFQQEAIARKLI